MPLNVKLRAKKIWYEVSLMKDGWYQMRDGLTPRTIISTMPSEEDRLRRSAILVANVVVNPVVVLFIILAYFLPSPPSVNSSHLPSRRPLLIEIHIQLSKDTIERRASTTRNSKEHPLRPGTPPPTRDIGTRR